MLVAVQNAFVRLCEALHLSLEVGPDLGRFFVKVATITVELLHDAFLRLNRVCAAVGQELRVALLDIQERAVRRW